MSERRTLLDGELGDAILIPLRLPHRSLLFAGRVLRAFRDNGGLLLAAALAYHALLSVMPLAMLAIATMSRFLEPALIVQAMTEQMGQFLLPGQEAALGEAIHGFMGNTEPGGLLGLAAVLFFSTLGVRTLQDAINVIFSYRHLAHGHRPLWLSAVIAVLYVTGICGALGLRAASALQPDNPLGSNGLHAASFIFLTLLLASAYRVMPVGKVSNRLSITGGLVAAGLWELLQLGLAWYFGEVSRVGVIYGSASTAVILLLTVEIAASIVLLGAQVIAELERSQDAGLPWHVDPVSMPPSAP